MKDSVFPSFLVSFFWGTRRTEKWVTLGENTQAVCHVTVYLLWLVLFLALWVHSSAGVGVIYYHLSLIPSIHLPEQAALPHPATAPPLPELCVTLCSLFKPATEETHSDNCSIGAVLHREPGWLDTRWMVIEKLRGRAGNESTKGYQTVRQIRERGEGKSKMKEGRWERWGDGRWQREISAEKQE